MYYYARANKRILSHYKFEVHMRNKTPKEYSFESFINDQINLNRDNLMTRHFAGLLNEKGLSYITI